MASGGRVIVNLAPTQGADAMLTPVLVERLRAAGAEVRDAPPPAASADLAGRIGGDAWAAIVTYGCPMFTPDVLDAVPGLRCIAYLGGSVKQLVTPEAFARGLTVLHAAPLIAVGVAEYCLTAALWLLRDLGGLDALLRAEPGGPGWRKGRARPPVRGLMGQPVGIVAASSTGRRFRELLQPFGCPVTVYDPHLTADDARALDVRLAPLDEVCAQPIVSVHAPGLPATRGLVGRAQIARVPDGAVFINSARAAVIDYAALTEALQAGRFRAALDVFPEEPLPPDSPLYGLPNVLLTPHRASYTAEGRHRMGAGVVEDLMRLLAGEVPRLAVDGRRWDVMAEP